MTVWRKLPTMTATAVVIETAVESAATSTDVRRSEPDRLREASSASTRKSFGRTREETRIARSVAIGIAKTPAATASRAAQYPKTGLPPTGGSRETAAAAGRKMRAAKRADFVFTRISHSRRARHGFNRRHLGGF